MPSGIQNAPSEFQCTMDVNFLATKRQFALTYLDDIVVFKKSREEHIEQVRNVFTILSDAVVISGFQRCCFFAKSVAYFGQVIRPRRLEISSSTTDAVRKPETPTFPTELRFFLGLCRVY